MKTPTRKTVQKWLINIALMITVYTTIQAYQGRHAPHSGPAPAINTLDIDGQQIDLEQLKGKATLIYFWATWCGICDLTRDSIHDISQHHPAITISTQSGDNENILAYQQKHNFNVTIINDQQGELSQRYGVKAFPTVFILNAEGHMSDVEIGLSSEWGLRLRLWLANL